MALFEFLLKMFKSFELNPHKCNRLVLSDDVLNHDLQIADFITLDETNTAAHFT